MADDRNDLHVRRMVTAGLCCLLACLRVGAQEGVYTTTSMTPETAIRAAQAAMDSCRKQGFQVSVAVVDRAGTTQVLLRDRFAGAHTVAVATDKAWTAASFRNTTAQLMQETQAGKVMSGMRSLPRFMAVAGGIPLESQGVPVGAIGVSGAPGGEADVSCALAGQKSIVELLDF